MATWVDSNKTVHVGVLTKKKVHRSLAFVVALKSLFLFFHTENWREIHGVPFQGG